jgi:hypothetical protein
MLRKFNRFFQNNIFRRWTPSRFNKKKTIQNCKFVLFAIKNMYFILRCINCNKQNRNSSLKTLFEKNNSFFLKLLFHLKSKF